MNVICRTKALARTLDAPEGPQAGSGQVVSYGYILPVTRPATILLVDSYASARGALADLLRASGYLVLEARTGEEGLQIARGRLPDLVIVDVWPFFSSAIHMMERLSRPGPTANIPVLVLTSLMAAQHRVRAAGCAGFLEKPCPPRAVLAEVRLLLHPFSTEAVLPPVDGPDNSA